MLSTGIATGTVITTSTELIEKPLLLQETSMPLYKLNIVLLTIFNRLSKNNKKYIPFNLKPPHKLYFKIYLID